MSVINKSVFLDFFGKIQEAEAKVERLYREVQALKKEVAELQMNSFDMALYYQKKEKK
jgi:BMFP domain-containing protein YqiC